MDGAERERLIREYRDGFGAVRDALDGIADDELDRSAEDGWTPRQVVHHLADAEMIGATRLRFLLALRQPVIQGYDEKTFAERFPYDGPIEPAMDMLRLARETSANLLDALPPSDWTRSGKHTERGEYTIEDWLTVYAPHARDHAAQIRRARGRA